MDALVALLILELRAKTRGHTLKWLVFSLVFVETCCRKRETTAVTKQQTHRDDAQKVTVATQTY